MKIETKFDIGDEVYANLNHRSSRVEDLDVLKGVIQQYDIRSVEKQEVTIECQIDFSERSTYCELEEKHLFASKEDLVEALAMEIKLKCEKSLKLLEEISKEL